MTTNATDPNATTTTPSGVPDMAANKKKVYYEGDLVEIYNDEETKKFNGGGMFAVVVRLANEEDREKNELNEGSLKDLIFYVCNWNGQLYCVNNEFLTLTQAGSNSPPDRVL